MYRLGIFLVGGLCALLLNTCSASNNVLMGVTRAEVAGHSVVVTDCYRLVVPEAQRLDDMADGSVVWLYAPCRDAVVLIQGDQLFVNNVPYGAIADGDEILVDHGEVYVNGAQRHFI